MEFIATGKTKTRNCRRSDISKSRAARNPFFPFWNKIKKQKADLEDIYDLFAIRVILETPPRTGKGRLLARYIRSSPICTSPNPKRMKDWLSIPKSQRIRVVTHHCAGAPKTTLGRGANTYPANGRNSRTRTCRPLEIQRN